MEIKKINDIAWERYPDGCMSWGCYQRPAFNAGAQYVINAFKELIEHFRYPEVGEMTDEVENLIMKLEGKE